MKNLFITLALLYSAHTYAFMSGLDDRRDTHGSLEIVGAYIPMGPEGMVNAGYMKLNNTSDADITLHYITSHRLFTTLFRFTQQYRKMVLLKWCTLKTL